jgi:hypothetical protein
MTVAMTPSVKVGGFVHMRVSEGLIRGRGRRVGWAGASPI